MALSGAALLQLQRSGGNGAVQRLIGGRDSTPKAVQRLDAKEKEKADSAQKLIVKAQGQASQATQALSGYADQAPGLLQNIEDTWKGGVALFKQAQEKVNFIISEAKAIQAVRDKVLLEIIDAASMGLLDKLHIGVGKVGAAAEELTLAEQEVVGAIRSSPSLKGVLEGVTGADPAKQAIAGAPEGVMPKGMAKEAAGFGKGDKGAATAAATDWADESKFYQSFADLKGKALQFLPVANLAAKLGGGIGKVDEALKNVSEFGRARKDYPLSQIVQDAGIIEGGTRRLAAAAPKIAGATKELQDLLSTAKMTAPTDAAEVEKELWVAWAAALGPSEVGALDMDYLENYLERKGIWKDLGIDRGFWFSEADQSVAVCSAKAQTMVTAHKGRSVRLTLYNGNPDRIAGLDIPGHADLPVRMASGSVGLDRDVAHVEGVIVGATTVKKVDSDVLGKTTPTKSVVAEYLLTHGYIAAIVRSFRELTPEELASPQ